MSIVTNLKKAVKDPSRAKSVLLAKIYSLFTRKQFSGSKRNRSDSDDGLYLASIQKILRSDRSFINFKKDPVYQSILEHTPKKAGQKYLDIILQQAPDILDNSLELCLQNDEVGNSTTHSYGEYGEISPSTLYYMKVASDLKVLFGDDIGKNIAEIGCGYGGQALILDSIFNLDKITLFDLALVNQLIFKYLECFTLRGSCKVSSLNEITPQTYSLVVSNYAFSELPKAIQIKYIEKVLSNSERGYLIMNSGRGNHTGEGEGNRLTLSELEALLPKFELFDEKPLTSPHNYVIAWGHNGSLGAS